MAQRSEEHVLGTWVIPHPQPQDASIIPKRCVCLIMPKCLIQPHCGPRHVSLHKQLHGAVTVEKGQQVLVAYTVIHNRARQPAGCRMQYQA